MGERGPARKPNALRVLHGEKRYRINTNEALPRDLPPVAPDWLHPYAREEWDRIAPDVEAMGVVKLVDSMALAAYCISVARLRRTCDLLDATALLLAEPVRKNPVVGMQRDASVDVRRWSHEFGFTPSARQPLQNTSSKSESDASRLLTGS